MPAPGVLLLQGKSGPAIIGYGKIDGRPQRISGEWRVPVRFESIADPTIETLAPGKELLTIKNSERFWRIQSSGVRLPDSVATDLESLVVGSLPPPRSEESGSNPDWTRDELIVALDFYLRHRPTPPAKDSDAIRNLSQIVRRLGRELHSDLDPSDTFRNENGVYMKLMNFRHQDPSYTGDGKVGLSRGAKADEDVWAAFAGDPAECHRVAEAIIKSVSAPSRATVFLGAEFDGGVQEAPEGRILTRLHVARERSRRLVETKRKQVLKKYGKLLCEACGFDFTSYYGERGNGFIECHHTKPVATLADGYKTHIDELALVCANCHRMIHRGKTWLSISQLKALVDATRSKGGYST